MKTKSLLLIGLCAVAPMVASAQGKKPKKNLALEGEKATPVELKKAGEFRQLALPIEEEPANYTVTEDCIANVSLFHESVKNKQFADALEPWEAVYKECPSASVNVYIDGSKIIEWKLSTLTAGTAEYNLWRDKLLKLHDNRIKYFANDPKYSKKYPKEYILGQKGVDYCTYFTEDKTKEVAYPWLKTSVESLGAASQFSVISKFMEVSYYMYKANPEKYTEQYITDYQLASGIYAAKAADSADKNAAAAQQYKDNLDQTFAGSGAANCDKLDELYAQKVQDNLNNYEELSKITAMYQRLGCGESDVYFAASAASHKLQPSAESAVGCAAMCKKKEDWRGAIEYYDQAVSLATTNADKAEYLYRAAAVYYGNLKNYSSARQYLRQSLEYDGNQGRCYIMIALMYAASRPYDDPILNRSVYWAAYDKAAKAKAVDPSVAESAQKLMNSYYAGFPTTEEIFFHNQLTKGGSFTVGGWIGESTVVRSRD